jgi:hypothetical protein
MRSMPSIDVSICVACGSKMTHVLRHAYRRCDGCVVSDTPPSLVLAREVKAAKLRGTHSLGDYDPSGCAAAG